MNTTNPTEVKQIVKKHYSEIVERSEKPASASCCGSDCGCSSDFDVMTEDYSKVAGYVKEADLALGCGIPTESARIKAGDTVLDLGSGAGNDCFVARSIVGDTGRVIGLDMTEKMIAKANENKAKLGFKNVEFRLGDIEDMLIESNSVDVVVSNCVLNLVPNKAKAFAGMFRVIKPGGHFAISDIVLHGTLPEKLQKDAAMYAGCVAGAIQKDEYLRLLEVSGFQEVSVVKDRETPLPNEFLLQYLSLEELRTMKKDRVGIYSITVVGEKPKK
jgi:arsenite methyltransferase